MNERRSWELPLLSLIVLVGAALRLIPLSAQSLWSDEIGTLLTCIKPLYKTVGAIALTDMNPPLFYILVHFWQMLGHSEFTLRLLPALLGIATIPLVWSLFRRKSTAIGAAVAAGAMAVWPAHIYYSGELRYQTLTALLAVLSFYALIALQEKDDRRHRWLYFAATVAGLYTHYFFLLLVASQFALVAFLRITQKHKIRLPWLRIGLAFVPGLLILLWQATHRNWGIKELVGSGQSQRLFSWLSLWSFGGVPWRGTTFFGWLDRWHVADPAVYQILFAILSLPVLVLIARGIWLARRDNFGRTIIAWAFFPPLMLLALSLAAPVFEPKLLIPTLPAIVILLAWGITSFQRKALTIIALAYFTLFAGLAVYQHQTDPRYFREDWRGTAQRLATDLREGDAILNASFELKYYSPIALPEVLMFARPIKELAAAGFVQSAEETAEYLRKALVDAKRVWFYDSPLKLPFVQTTSTYLEENYFEITPEQYVTPPRLRLFMPMDRHAYAAYLASKLSDKVDFVSGQFTPHQLRGPWLATDEGWRWATNSSSVWIKRKPTSQYIRAEIYVNMDLIPPGCTNISAEHCLQVELLVEGVAVANATVVKSDRYELTGSLPSELNDMAAVEVALKTDRIIYQDTNERIAPDQARTLLVGQIELLDATLDDAASNGQPAN